MDKTHFIKAAPAYYALAIAQFFQKTGQRPASRQTIRTHYLDDDPESDPSNPYCFLEKKLVFDQAIVLLSRKGVIEVQRDDFGPPVFTPTSQFYLSVSQLEEDQTLPFKKFSELQDREAWLRSALKNLNDTYDNLRIVDVDFDNPDSEWQPLPLERDAPELQAAISKLDETIEQVRGDNGYSTTVPEEKAYVLETLSSASRVLKQATSVSLPFVRRYALEPLQMLIRRFGTAATGIIATAARDALVDFLKQHGIRLLERIF